MLQKKEDIGSGLKTKHEGTLSRDACPYCGRAKAFERISLGELATSILCGILLMAITIPLICVTEHWLDHQAQKSFDNLIWRERIENW